MDSAPHPVPLAGLLSAWGSAFLQGRAGADEVLDVLSLDVFGDSSTPLRHVVIGLGGGEEGVIPALARLRASGVIGLRPVLPVPGDVLGLPGPAAFLRDATDAGQAVLTAGPTWWGLVPRQSGGDVRWQATPVEPSVGARGLPSLAEAERALAEALRDGTAALAALDVAGGRDEVDADLARTWRRVPRAALPDLLPGRAVALLDRGTRVAAILAVAERHAGATVTAAEARSRLDALAPLARAARQAVTAAFAAAAEPVPDRG